MRLLSGSDRTERLSSTSVAVMSGMFSSVDATSEVVGGVVVTGVAVVAVPASGAVVEGVDSGMPFSLSLAILAAASAVTRSFRTLA